MVVCDECNLTRSTSVLSFSLEFLVAERSAKGWTIVDVDSEKRELLSGLVQYMDNFEAGVKKTVVLFQGGEIEQAKKNTIEIIDGLGWIMEGIDVLRGLLNIDVSKLVGPLEQLQVSLENEDDVLTSDLFENELLPSIVAWKQRMVDIDTGSVASN